MASESDQNAIGNLIRNLARILVRFLLKILNRKITSEFSFSPGPWRHLESMLWLLKIAMHFWFLSFCAQLEP
jgi:hypothetical protein